MKILHTVEFYNPSVGGMQEVVKQLSERLVKLGHEVTVATTHLAERKEPSLNGVKIAEFKVSGNSVRGMKGDVDAYKRFLLDSDFDIVTNFAAQQWATDLALPLLERMKAKKVFVPTGFSGLYEPQYKEYFESMKAWMTQYDMNIFLSNNYRDIDFAKKNHVEKYCVIPNGAGADEFLPRRGTDVRARFGIPDDYFLTIHVGSHTGVKGHKEAISIFKRAKIQKAAFLMIGNGLGGGCTARCNANSFAYRFSFNRAQQEKKLVVTSLSREETVAAYQQADLFLFPSNIECSPIVLFECMAARTPFLTSDIGNAKEIIEWSGGGALLPTEKDQFGYSHVHIDESVSLFENIYKDAELRRSMAESGYKAWEEKFSWERITHQYEQLYSALMAGNV